MDRTLLKTTQAAGRRWLTPAVLLLASFIILTICSKCSFIYGFNDWVDMNWFYTMGDGMFSGRLPYRDLFEQKGPVIYFLFGLCSRVPGGSLMGVFAVEVLCLFFYMRFACKLAERYLDGFFPPAVAVASGVLAVTSYAFNQGGGAVEEYCLPLLMYGLYRFIVYFEDGTPITGRQMLGMGVMVGLILWSKYVTALFFVIMLLLWLWDMLRVKKQGAAAAKGVLMAFAGIFIVTVPVLLYFGLNGALQGLWRCYIYDNVVTYRGSSVAPQVLLGLGFVAADAPAGAALAYGMFRYCRSKRHPKRASVSLLILVLSQLLQMLVFGYFSYYYLVVVAFVPLGVIPLCLRLSRRQNGETAGVWRRRRGPTVAAFCGFALLFTMLLGNNTVELFDNRKYVQPQVAEDIRASGAESPTLLCYKLMDYGFYRAADLTPVTYYFALNNYSRKELPEMYDEYERYVETGLTDFVVARREDYQAERERFARYSLVNEYSYGYFGSPFYHFEAEFVLLRRI